MADNPLCDMADKAIGNGKQKLVSPQESHKNGTVGEKGANPGSSYAPKKGS